MRSQAANSAQLRSAAIATPHPAAADAAKQILLAGGNAIDAAVGAMLACCVVTPGAVGLGGYGGSLVAYLARSRKTIAIDFDSRAPLAYRPEFFSDNSQSYESGYLSITVPAVVAGLALALEKFGTQSWAAVSQPAIRLAEDGITISLLLKKQLDDFAKKADRVSQQALFPGGNVPAAGETWRQPDVARLLVRLAENGPQAFYRGEIPQTIVHQVQTGGGILSEQDFEQYQPAVAEPLAIDYRGYRVLTPRPPSGGLTTLQILKVLEQFNFSQLQPWSSDYFHLFAEATKLCWQDRIAYFGDPDATEIPVGQLLSAEAATAKAARIDRVRAQRFAADNSASPHHTANILVADREGNVVSVTATQGYLYGSQVAIDRLGLVMGHGMSRFDLAAGSPNAPAAGKRMFHNMAPAILLNSANHPFAAVGLPGGPKIVTVTAQLIINLIDFHASPAAAVSAPRIHIEANEPLAITATVPESVAEQLRSFGHTVIHGQTVGGQPDEIGGKANAIVIDPATRSMTAASQAGEAAACILNGDSDCLDLQ
ncbi:MAG TPA: gamma-glutamyltransferase [Pirellulaceae bacterium]|jgi:gamma-glutamyltranspeptidase/glutathione hydrolase